jgi:4-hydroxybenzoate polyprenyltransferase
VLAADRAGLSNLFYLGAAAYGFQLSWQARRVRVDDPQRALRLFKSNAWAGLILFFAIVMGAIPLPAGL